MDADPRLVTARSLLVDRVAAEVTGALRARGVASILLKGRSVQRLLYTDGAPRPYGDVDVLVAPDRQRAAATVLEGLGYAPLRDSPHAQSWSRGSDQVDIDLHRTLSGAGAQPAEVWDTLAARTETIAVGPEKVDVLLPPAIALHLALHAVHHSGDHRRPLADLERAVDRFGEAIWRDAAALAATLEATERLAAGLRLVPGGERLAARLGLSTSVSVKTALRLGGDVSGSYAVARVAGAPGLRAKLAELRRVRVPPDAPARGRLRRAGWMVRRSAPALVAWWRALRTSRRSDRR